MSRGIIAALLSAAVAGTATAQVSNITDPVRTRDGVRYACTGVGSESRQDPRWREFAAKLVFAAGSGGYLSQVGTRITDSQGRTVFEVLDCGPWLLLDLPAGRYDVVATAHDGHGRTYQSRSTISVGGAGQRETIVRFPEIPG